MLDEALCSSHGLGLQISCNQSTIANKLRIQIHCMTDKYHTVEEVYSIMSIHSSRSDRATAHIYCVVIP